MTIHLLNVLPKSVPLRPWLERQIVGPDLSEVVRELQMVHGPAAPSDDVTALLAARKADLLRDGLSALNDEELGLLLRHPGVLLAVQRWALTEGGSYWDGVLSGWHATAVAAPVARRSPWVLRGPWIAGGAVAGAAVAAAVLLWVMGLTSGPGHKGNDEMALIAETPPDRVMEVLAMRLQLDWEAARQAEDATAALRHLEQSLRTLAATPLPLLTEPARVGLRNDLRLLEWVVAERRAELAHGREARLARADTDGAVKTIVGGWQDPPDLPDWDPSNLPS